jgi:hypothetical protein
MSEQEKIDIIRVIREELQSHKDYADVKYATNEALNEAKNNRDTTCEAHRATFTECVTDIKSTLNKMDKQFIYMMVGLIGVGIIAGLDNLLPLVGKIVLGMIGV